MTAAAKKDKAGPTIVKKYANRRLYDTGRSSYVTLDDLAEMVREDHDFKVVDAKSGEDLTRQVLAQIVLEQETREDAEPLLPVSFMRQIIGLYGENFGNFLPGYLEQSMEIFARNQELLQDQINKSLEGMMQVGASPLTALEEMNRQNMAMFETAMRAFTPFVPGANTNKKDD